MSVRPRHPSRPVGLSVSTLALLLQLGCSSESIITLGQGDPRPRFYGGARPIPILNSPKDDDNPTLTEDMLQIYFTSEREDGMGGSDVWYATRTSRRDPFGKPQPLTEANSEDDETSTAISADGKTLWIASRRPTSDDDEDNDNNIWRMRRDAQGQWQVPELVGDLNSDYDDIPRPVALDGTVMPIASKRRNDDDYETFLARRTSPDEAFEPEPEPITEIMEAGRSTVDAFMTNDGLLVFFNRSQGEDNGDLYMAWRSSPDEPFSAALPLSDINTDADERDPWVNAEGTRFFFSRKNGEAGLDIYMSYVELPSASELASH